MWLSSWALHKYSESLKEGGTSSTAAFEHGTRLRRPLLQRWNDDEKMMNVRELLYTYADTDGGDFVTPCPILRGDALLSGGRSRSNGSS